MKHPLWLSDWLYTVEHNIQKEKIEYCYPTDELFPYDLHFGTMIHLQLIPSCEEESVHR